MQTITARWGTSTSWGPSLTCRQALTWENINNLIFFSTAADEMETNHTRSSQNYTIKTDFPLFIRLLSNLNRWASLNSGLFVKPLVNVPGFEVFQFWSNLGFVSSCHSRFLCTAPQVDPQYAFVPNNCCWHATNIIFEGYEKHSESCISTLHLGLNTSI